MPDKVIVHISEVPIEPNSGMGRVEYYWQKAFQQQGIRFIHIGPDEVGTVKHKGLFPWQAYRYFKSLKIKPLAFIVHEPAAGFFVKRGVPCFVESHGVERRYWDAKLRQVVPTEAPVSFKTRMFYPLWRLLSCDRGMRKAHKLLLINSDDRNYVQQQYGRSAQDIYLFRNGVHLSTTVQAPLPQKFTVVFNGSWIGRKGIDTLVAAARLLEQEQLEIYYSLIGTGFDTQTVLSQWPEALHEKVKVVQQFLPEQESSLLNAASIFVLPSYFEGQPLSLLQAMALGKCCITTECCGQKDMVEHGQTGLLFPPGDPFKLAQHIKSCYNDPQMIAAIGLNARKAVEQYNWDAVAADLVDYVLENAKN